MSETARNAGNKPLKDSLGMTRRGALQTGLAAGMTLTSASALFAATKPPEPSGPRKGGDFKMAISAGSSKDTFDPASWRNGFMADAGQMIGNTLVAIDAKNVPQPDLAESFEPSDGGKTWVFKLRSGVTFHNGKSLTADDVVATYNYHRDKKSNSAARSVLSGLAEIKADGPRNVVFKLGSAHADFPYVTSDYHLQIFGAKDGSIDFADAAGTGPYIKDEFKAGTKLTGRRNPNYHRSDAAWFDTVELQVIADAGKRQEALFSGAVHYIDQLDVRSIGALKRRRDIKITEIAGFNHYVAPMNCSVKPFDDVHVRQAIKWSINRDELIKRVLGGYGTTGNDVPLSPSMRFANSPEPKFHYDPDKAKRLLKVAGYNSLKLDLSASDAAFAGAYDAAMLIKASARKANIDINVIKEPAEGYLDLVWMKKPWVMSYWSGRATADWMLTTAYSDETQWNDSSWKYPKFNDLLRAARAEMDDQKRAEKYTEMQQILHDDGGALILMFDNYLAAHSAKVDHGELNSNSDHDGGQIFQRWWMV